jgi:hypothetical protein
MKKIYMTIIPALLLFTFITGCKKDSNDSVGNTAPSLKLEKLTRYHQGVVYDAQAFQYDIKGMLIRVGYYDGSFDSLLYTSSQVLRNHYSSSGLLTGADTYTLNPNGLASYVHYGSKKDGKSLEDKVTGWMDIIKHSTGTNEVFREYNAEEYLVKETYYNYSSYGDTLNYFYAISNGNISGMTRTSSLPSTSYTLVETYSYYTDKQNTISNQNKGISFLGKQNKNLVNSIITTYDNYYSPDTVRYIYKFDNNNRVATRYTYLSYSQIIDSTFYTYKN